MTAQLGARRMHGTIDRLIVTPSAVHVVDFKSNRVVPDGPATCPVGLLAQMAAYDAALRQIYPDRSIEVSILWTRTAELMTLPYDSLSDAATRTIS